MMNYEWRLLQEYRSLGSEWSFAKLTERHLKLVHATCLREVGNRCLAEDITQAVLLIFVRKIDTIREDTKLAGWFYQTAKFVSRNALRQEARRRTRETEAAQETIRMNSRQTSHWDIVEPQINSALDQLGATDREAVLLHYFEGASMREVGEALGVSEDAAKMRVSRAVNKLRGRLSRKEVFISTTALAAVLLANALDTVAHAGTDIRSIVRAVHRMSEIESTPTRSTQIAQGAMKTMLRTQITTAAVAMIAVLIGASATMTANGKANSHATTALMGAAWPPHHAAVTIAATTPVATSSASNPSLPVGVKLAANKSPHQTSQVYFVCNICKCYYTPAQAAKLGYREGPNGHRLVRTTHVPAGYKHATYI